MNWLNSLERRFGSMAIPNLTVYLIAMQSIGVALLLGHYANELDLLLHGSSVMHRGEWWRLFSFMMLPRTLSPIWLLFAFYVFYLMGSALEREWGAFRYNLFILCGYLLTVAVAFIDPGAIISNTYFLGCVFLAFATLYPNFEFHLFFLIPVKVKWLGWLTAGSYLFVLITADAGSRLCVLAALATYALFFGRAFIGRISAARRRNAYAARTAVAELQTRHTCAVCGATDKDSTHHFRYCSTCGNCYCEEHLSSHGH